MTTHTPALVFALALCVAAPATAIAQTAAAAKPAPAKSTASKKAAPAKKAAEPAPPEAAGPEQIDAADRVYYGVHDCEFKQSIDIGKSTRYPSYVEVKHGKADYVMKPVMSSTGALRLEDVRGETLMVQIAAKSMLLNVKTAQRIVDDCVSPKQRELIETARVAKAAAAASAAAGDAASAPAGVSPAASALLSTSPEPAATK